MAAVCGPMVCGGAAQAANDSDTGAATGCPSLKLVPESAAYYTAMLRGREQYDAVVGSHAWVQLKALPVVQMGVALYNIQAANPETPLGKIQAACQDPAGQKLLEFGGDMFSHEVFSYGEPSAVDALQLVQRVVGAMRYGPLMLQMSQKTEGMSQPDQEAMLILKVLSENLPLLKVPENGGRLQNQQPRFGQRGIAGVGETGHRGTGEVSAFEGPADEDHGRRARVSDPRAGRPNDPLG